MATMSDRMPRISAGQFATMITAGYLGLGIFYFPRPLVEDAGRVGLYGLWLDGLAAFLLMKLIFAMGRLIPNETLSGFSAALLSKPVSWLLALYTIVYHLALAISAVVLFSFVLGNIFLPSTPIWAISGALTLTSAYMAYGGVLALARTLQASYIPLLVLTIFSVSMATLSIRHPSLLLPTTDVSLLPLVDGAYHQFVIFIGFQLSVTLYPFVKNGEQRQAERYSVLALAGIVLALSLEYEVIMAVFGPDAIDRLRWPLASTYRIISLSGFYISKLGTLLIVLWTIVIVAFVAVRLWCLAHDLSAMAPRRLSYELALGLMTLATILGTLPFPNAKVANLLNEHYLLPLGLAYLVLVPGTVMVVGKLRPQATRQLRARHEPGPEV
ncbi:MAG: GerAB/ArcD/ProY family transporter [Firmicutes bacterium]|nr:GerAB/ArcD/ProY family transporter [Bacillota bacterium]